MATKDTDNPFEERKFTEKEINITASILQAIIASDEDITIDDFVEVMNEHRDNYNDNIDRIITKLEEDA